MRVIVNGACGRMGRAVWERIGEEPDMIAVAGVDPHADESDPRLFLRFSDFDGEADMIIDFSDHRCTNMLTGYAILRGCPCVIATTGQSEEELRLIESAAERVPIFLSANTSLGVAMLAEFAHRAALLFPGAQAEIVETHHAQKRDAPSGTALLLAKALKSGNGAEKIPIHSLRIGKCVGKHEIILSVGEETITLTHEAHSRTLFAVGALAAARFLLGKPAGLYDVQSLIKEYENSNQRKLQTP